MDARDRARTRTSHLSGVHERLRVAGPDRDRRGEGRRGRPPAHRRRGGRAGVEVIVEAAASTTKRLDCHLTVLLPALLRESAAGEDVATFGDISRDHRGITGCSVPVFRDMHAQAPQGAAIPLYKTKPRIPMGFAGLPACSPKAHTGSEPVARIVLAISRTQPGGLDGRWQQARPGACSALVRTASDMCAGDAR